MPTEGRRDSFLRRFLRRFGYGGRGAQPARKKPTHIENARTRRRSLGQRGDGGTRMHRAPTRRFVPKAQRWRQQEVVDAVQREKMAQRRERERKEQA